MPTAAAFPRSRKELALRGGAAAGIILLAGWFTIAAGLAMASANMDPDLALRLRSHDARANARKAEIAVADGVGDAARRTEAETYARAALSREPISVVGWRTLGVVAAGQNDGTKAKMYFDFAARLSRRDLPTQIWLIEDSVNRGRVAEALKHYDAALRTSASSHDMLLPVLVSATSDPRIVDELIKVLRPAPWWRRPFIGRLAEDAPDPVQAVRLMRGLASDGKLPETDLVRFMIAKMVQKNAVPSAWQLYAILKGQPNLRPTPLRDGQFAGTDAIIPFEWQLEPNAQLGAEQLDDGAQGHVLHIYARDGVTGFVARQLMQLPPGQYVLSGAAGAVEGVTAAQPYWTVVCSGEGTSLGEADVDASKMQPTPWSGSFTVPAQKCTAQWLLFGIRSDTQGRQVDANLAKIAVTPQSRAASAAAK